MSRGGGRRGWGGPRGFGGPGSGGPRARRGDFRLAALLLLAEEPRNGYGLMQAIEERTDGLWRPSPGSVYPALAQLEDEGLVRVEEAEGRKLFHLTDAGRRHVEERGDVTPPWEAVTRNAGEDPRALMHGMRDLALALHQVGQAGTPEQIEQAKAILAQARKDLYRILAGAE